MLLVAFSLIFLLALSNFRQQRAGITSLTFVDVYQRSMLRFIQIQEKWGTVSNFSQKVPLSNQGQIHFFLNPKNTETGG